jgi:hypothetical protein
LEAWLAETGGFKAIHGQTTQNLLGDDEALAPARSFIKAALGHTTKIVAAAQRASFIMAQPGTPDITLLFI